MYLSIARLLSEQGQVKSAHSSSSVFHGVSLVQRKIKRLQSKKCYRNKSNLLDEDVKLLKLFTEHDKMMILSRFNDYWVASMLRHHNSPTAQQGQRAMQSRLSQLVKISVSLIVSKRDNHLSSAFLPGPNVSLN